jgi:hypothetical protein
MFNKKRIVTIAEPWDFTSSDGDNKLIVKILSEIKYGLIVKCCSNFNGKTNRLLFVERCPYYEDYNMYRGTYNIYKINDSISGDEMDIASLKFIMIGVMG